MGTIDPHKAIKSPLEVKSRSKWYSENWDQSKHPELKEETVDEEEDPSEGAIWIYYKGFQIINKLILK